MLKCDRHICEYPDCEKTCGLSELELIKHLQKQVRDARVDIRWAESTLYAIRAQVDRVHGEIKQRLPAYEPTCPCGYIDCVGDPAYIRWTNPKWWKELDMPTSCADLNYGKPCHKVDEDGNLYCEHYDDEDK